MLVKRVVLTICTAVALASFAGAASAAVSSSLSFPVAKAPHPLALDPSLSDPAWQAGKIQASSWQNLTARKPAAHTTTTYLLYDDRNLYIGFEAEQVGTPIIATQHTNDVGFGVDDFVGIGIDTSSSGSQTYFFETTPAGTRYQQASENARYRPHWQSASSIQGGNWRAVMIVPLGALRMQNGNQTWRVNFIRSIASVAEHYSWAYDGVMQDGGNGQWPSFSDVRFWPTATGIDAVSKRATRPKPRLEVYALGSVGHDRTLFQQADGEFLPQKIRPVGIDLSVPLTPTINFVGTLAPDFSNVEIDQQTIAPQEFRRQLNEYRPFFSQGANFINAAINPYDNFAGPQNLVFYSPGVGPFDRGEKLEGTFGKQSFGVLNFRGFDQVTGNEFDDTAFGYKHALEDTTFSYYADGVFAHHSVAGDDSTVEYGVKGRNLKNGLVYNFNGDVEHGSWVPGGSAHSANAFLDIHKPNYETNFGYADISPNYNPIDGYTSNSDIHGFQGFFAVNGSDKLLKNWSIFASGDRFFDRSGALHEVDDSLSLNATFHNGFSIDGGGPSVGLLRSYDVVGGSGCNGPSVGRSTFTGAPCYRNGQTQPFNLMNIPIGYRDGTPTPIDVSAAWGNFSPNYLHLYSATTSHPLGKNMTLGLEYDGTYQRNLASGGLDSQWLRRISLGINTGADSNLTLSLRDINGLGGFAPQAGLNLAAAFHLAFHSGDLYLNYGTPAASYTLDRFIVKYVFRAGADAGT